MLEPSVPLYHRPGIYRPRSDAIGVMTRQELCDLIVASVKMAASQSQDQMERVKKNRRNIHGDHCAALNCINARLKASCKGKSFFRFPKEEER